MPSGVYHRTPKMRERIRQNLAKGHEPKAREKAVASLRANAQNPEFRQLVSDRVRVAMRSPEIRARHLAGLARQEGINFRGGNGQEPTQVVLFATAILTPLNFVREHPIRTAGHGTVHRPPTVYKADFANPNTMTVIELDGPSHNSMDKRAADRRKTEVLTALGWRVIRVPHGVF